MFRNKVNTVAAAILAGAFVICAIAWMRFFWVAATNPSPVRYLEFVASDGPRDPFRQSCTGPSFIDGGRVWRTCEYGPTDPETGQAAQWGLVRINLELGRAAMRWPLDGGGPTSQILALAHSPLDDIAVVWGSPNLSAITRVVSRGGLESLGIPPSMLGNIAGMAWAGEALELVSSRDESVLIHAFRGEAWAEPRTVTRPAQCNHQTVLCVLQLAYHEEAGWRLLYAAVPRQIVDPARSRITPLLADESGTEITTKARPIPLASLGTDLYTIKDERLIRLGYFVDRAPGNVVNWTVNSPPLVWDGDNWFHMTLPDTQASASLYYSDYQVRQDGLRWIPGMRYPERAWKLDRWLTLQSSAEGITLAELGGTPGPVLTPNTILVEKGGSQTSILPAPDGYWVLGPYGSYLKADKSLARADSLNLTERIRRAFDNFGRLRPYNEAFYRDQALLKVFAFPLVLLALPLGYLTVFFMQQVRRYRRAWIWLLVRVSTFYLIVVTIFMWWFWETMGGF